MAQPPIGYRRTAQAVVAPVAARPALPEDRGAGGRLDYPLGSWVGGKFVFDSPEAERQWHGNSFMQGSNHLLWMKGRRLRPEENALAEMGLPHSDDVYPGPDGQHYQMLQAAREHPKATAIRMDALAREPAQGSATEMGTRASLKALPKALALMARDDRAPAGTNALKPPAANDNRAAASENRAAASPPPSSSVISETTAANPTVPAASRPSHAARAEPAELAKGAAPSSSAAPGPKTVAERAAYGRSGHLTPEERQAAADDVRLVYSGATAGYGDNAIAALKAFGAYVSGEDFGASYDAALSAEEQKTEEARRRQGIAAALIESLPSFIPGYGDVTGLIADLKMYREHPDELTWKNAGMTALGLLPFVPSAAGAIRQVDKAIDAAEDGAKAVAKENDKVKQIEKTVEEATPADWFSKNYQKKYYDENPEHKGKSVIHRAIERQVLDRYPGLFDEAEIYALENLRGVPKELNNDLHLKFIRRELDKFYDMYPMATREQVLIKVAEIDRMIGHLYLPTGKKK